MRVPLGLTLLRWMCVILAVLGFMAAAGTGDHYVWQVKEVGIEAAGPDPFEKEVYLYLMTLLFLVLAVLCHRMENIISKRRP